MQKSLMVNIMQENIYDKKQGFNITLLESGTKIIVETINSVYEFVVIEGREVTIMGGINSKGKIRYKKPIPAILIGSTCDDCFIKQDWIGNNMSIQCSLQEKGSTKLISTSVVRNAKIVAPNLEWSYSMDWNEIVC